MTKKNLILIILIIGFSFQVLCLRVAAEEMSSGNYLIPVDSINVGGLISTTSNYDMNITIGEAATGLSTTTDYQLKAGYQQMLEEGYISISVSSTVSMAPNIQRLSGGQSDGSGGAVVITDSASGYSLSIKASTAPALAGAGDSFADYTPQVAGTPDFSWSIPTNDSEFGYSPEGSDIVQKFKDNGSSCNTGSSDTSDACWDDFSTSYETIALSYSANTPTGTPTTLKFRAESGSSHTQTPGSYQATITLTAITN